METECFLDATAVRSLTLSIPNPIHFVKRNLEAKINWNTQTNLSPVNVTNPQDGAFAEHIQSRGDVVVKIPSTMSFTDAATLPVGLFTIGLGFYKHLGLPFPPSISDFRGEEWIFIYGGSSASGTLAIQFAKL